jgi:uncharacterized protein YcbX
MSATVKQLFRFPVKSMAGQAHSTLEITQRGVVGDRVWAVRDEVRGGIRGGKKIPSLMTLAARFVGEPIAEGSSSAIITAADDSERETGSEGINEWLSEKLDHPVTLWPLLPAEALDHYRRGAPDNEDFETEMRELFARNADEPLPDLEMFAEVIDYESPPGTYFDAFPILIMTEQSLATMARHRPESVFDVDRFRPNLLLDAPNSDHPFPESQWVGQQVQVGEVVFEIIGDCPRCVMTTHGFSKLEEDPGIMRALVEAHEGNLGVYAKVVKGGRLSVGDTLTQLADAGN